MHASEKRREKTLCRISRGIPLKSPGCNCSLTNRGSLNWCRTQELRWGPYGFGFTWWGCCVFISSFGWVQSKLWMIEWVLEMTNHWSKKQGELLTQTDFLMHNNAFLSTTYSMHNIAACLCRQQCSWKMLAMNSDEWRISFNDPWEIPIATSLWIISWSGYPAIRWMGTSYHLHGNFHHRTSPWWGLKHRYLQSLAKRIQVRQVCG